MADARLVATNPEDSSLVAVACTPEGLLRTEGGAEGPPGPKGDPGAQGDPGPKGDPGSSFVSDPAEQANGAMLVVNDGSLIYTQPYDGSWLSTLTSPSGFSPASPASNAFDGNFATFAVPEPGGKHLIFECPVDYPNLIFGVGFRTAGQTAKFLYGDTTQMVTTGGPESPTVFSRIMGTFMPRGAQIQFNIEGSIEQFAAIYVNGNICIDVNLALDSIYRRQRISMAAIAKATGVNLNELLPEEESGLT